jgi:hypothetical protein
MKYIILTLVFLLVLLCELLTNTRKLIALRYHTSCGDGAIKTFNDRFALHGSVQPMRLSFE